MTVRKIAEQEPFTTADGSTIRSILDLSNASVEKQSLAEATLPPGEATERHWHKASEELYFILEGSGNMEIEGKNRRSAWAMPSSFPAGNGTRSQQMKIRNCVFCAAARHPTPTRTHFLDRNPAYLA